MPYYTVEAYAYGEEIEASSAEEAKKQFMEAIKNGVVDFEITVTEADEEDDESE